MPRTVICKDCGAEVPIEPRSRKLKPRSFEPGELKDHAGGVRYELEMLVYAAEDLEWGHSSPESAPGGEAKCIALESFLLHFRNLRDFLCISSSADDDDLFASDFLGEPAAMDIGNRAVLVDKAEVDRLNKMLAHLSRKRREYIKDRDAEWPTAQMAITMLSEFRRFLDDERLSSQRRGWFREDKWISDKINDLGFYASQARSNSSGGATSTASESTLLNLSDASRFLAE